MDDAPIMNEGPDQQVFLPIASPSPTPTPLIWDSSLRLPYYASLDRLWFKSTDWNAHPNRLRNRFTLAYPDRPSETIPSAYAPSTIPFSSSTAEWHPKHGIYSYYNRAADLAATLPVELLDNILYYAGCQEKLQVPANSTTFCRPRPPPGAHKGFLACSPVCLRWANKCRQYLFSGATLLVSSCEKAEMLIHYALYGCASLVPLHTLISKIIVDQKYDMPYSFLYRVFLLRSVTGKRLEFYQLELSGPIPDDFPSCKRDTPHWSIPSSIPTPPSMLSYTAISLRNIHLPSFTHVVKYISHFRSATLTGIVRLTWNDDDAGSSIQAGDVARIRRGDFHKMGNKELTLCILGCTNTARLFLHALIANIRSPLYAISDSLPANDRGAMVGLLQGLFYGVFKSVRLVSIRIIYLRAESLAAGKLTVKISLELNNWRPFFILEDNEPRSLLTPNLHVVGFMNCPPDHTDSDDYDLILDDLMPYLHQFPMLRAMAIVFDIYQELSLGMSPYRPLPFHPLITNNQYVLVIRRFNRGWLEVLDFPEIVPLPSDGDTDYIGINPITLLPTGQVWKDRDDIIPSLLAIPGP